MWIRVGPRFINLANVTTVHPQHQQARDGRWEDWVDISTINDSHSLTVPAADAELLLAAVRSQLHTPSPADGGRTRLVANLVKRLKDQRALKVEAVSGWEEERQECRRLQAENDRLREQLALYTGRANGVAG